MEGTTTKLLIVIHKQSPVAECRGVFCVNTLSKSAGRSRQTNSSTDLKADDSTDDDFVSRCLRQVSDPSNFRISGVAMASRFSHFVDLHAGAMSREGLSFLKQIWTNANLPDIFFFRG